MLLRSWFRRTFRALELREFRILWIGSVLMFVGMQFLMIAMSVLAYDLTGSKGALGAVNFGFAIPMLLLSLWGGVVADRFPKRKLLLVTQVIMSLNAGWIAVMVMTGLIAFWMLFVFAMVMGAAFSFAGPARMAFTTDIVGKERLPNAIALQQLSMRSTQVIGPALAGVLISVPFIGIAGAYTVTTIGFSLTAVSMLWLSAGNPQPREQQTTPMVDLTDGMRYVRRNGTIATLMLMSFIVIGLGFSFETFLVAMSEDIFDAGTIGFGILSAATAVGAVLAALVVAGYVDHPKAWMAQIVLAVAFGVALALLGLAPVFAVAVVIAAFLGLLSSSFQTINSSLVMTTTDREYQGRVQSINMLGFSLVGFTALPVGLIADAVGLRVTLVAQGSLLAGIMLLLGLWSMMRWRAARPVGRIDREPGPAPAGGGGR